MKTAILQHIKADGPVSIGNIIAYCKVQFPKADPSRVVNAVIDLETASVISKYDAGHYWAI